MGFLNKIQAAVGQGVAGVANQADKTIRLTRLANELAAKRHDLDRAYQELGQAAYALLASGAVTAESLKEVQQKIDDLQAQVKTLEEEVAEVRVGDRTPEVKVTSVERPCPSCGKDVPEGMQFCGHCGHAMQ